VTIQVFMPQDMTALQRELASVHAELAFNQVNRLTVPLEVKRNIIDAVRDAVLREAETTNNINSGEQNHEITSEENPC
jgi:hypothetical protein